MSNLNNLTQIKINKMKSKTNKKMHKRVMKCYPKKISWQKLKVKIEKEE